MTCETVNTQLPLFVYGELSFDEEEHVQQHLDVCEACRSALERLQSLHAALDMVEPDPGISLLADNRRALRLRIATAGDARARRRAWIPTWLARPVAAAALVALGFFGARAIPSDAGAFSGELSRASVSEPAATRVRYVEPSESGDVRILVEEIRQRVLSGRMDDEPIRRLLLTAARDSSDPGVRVETMDLLKSQPQSEDIRQALLHALRHDTNAGVRLKALEGLRGFAQELETRRVLAEVLLTDENPGVRTQAIDLLTQQPEPQIVGVLQELMAQEDNSYVRLKCQKVLHDMNASTETF
jgi:hypothetical protein